MWTNRYIRTHKRGKAVQKRKRKKRGEVFAWILIGSSICTGSFLYCLLFPLLSETESGGDSSAFVNGFVTNKSAIRSKPSGSISTMANEKEKQEAYFADEESPIPALQQRQKSNQPLKAIFYQPSDPLDNEKFGFKSNPTVFGSILRGELSTKLLLETTELIAFEDIKPRATFHALIIPKQLIPSVLELHPDDPISLTTLNRMSQVAHDLLQREQPEAYRTGDYTLCFHIPPFNSVDHLHLHVLAPASQMAPWYKNGKYNCGTDVSKSNNPFQVRWCIGLSNVETNLQRGESPTPYNRNDSWATILSDTASSIRSILASSFGDD